MQPVEFILYVRDQAASRKFYCNVLGINPQLDVPGMAEFALNTGAILGLMPLQGILGLLGLDQSSAAETRQPRCELYLHVPDPDTALCTVEREGGTILSPASLRSWGEEVGYASDLDGHVLAFARAK